jgi:hypothetical protein
MAPRQTYGLCQRFLQIDPGGFGTSALTGGGVRLLPILSTRLPFPEITRDATPEQAASHGWQTAETARYELGRSSSNDQNGY